MKTTILLEIDLEKPVPNLLAHIENRASTISGVRLAEGRVVASTLERDAARYAKLEQAYCAANFKPEDPDGLDLGQPGIALIFLFDRGTRFSVDCGDTVDSAVVFHEVAH